MNYLTQHYKNRCEQLQEQINVLSVHLNKLMEAAAVASTEAPEAAEASAPTYGGEGLSQLLGSFNGMTPANQAALKAYLSAWQAQNMGGGGAPSAPPAMRSMAAPSSSTGKSVANVARDIMAGSPGAASEEEETTTTPTGGGMGSGGGSNIPGDYNGDGVVDGADLSIALGNFGREGYDMNKVLQNWSGGGGKEVIRGTINPRRKV